MEEDIKNLFKYMSASDISNELDKAFDIFKVDFENKTVTIKAHDITEIINSLSTETIKNIHDNPYLNWDKANLEYSFLINNKKACELACLYVERFLYSFVEMILKDFTWILEIPDVFNPSLDYLRTIYQYFKIGTSEFILFVNKDNTFIVKYIGEAESKITWVLNIPHIFYDECKT